MHSSSSSNSSNPKGSHSKRDGAQPADARLPFPLQRQIDDAACDGPELAAFLSEAVDSKRSAREKLMRSIRLDHPAIAVALQTQIPLAPSKPDSDSSPGEPLSEFLLKRIAADAMDPSSTGAGSDSACEGHLAR